MLVKESIAAVIRDQESTQMPAAEQKEKSMLNYTTSTLETQAKNVAASFGKKVLL